MKRWWVPLGALAIFALLLLYVVHFDCPKPTEQEQEVQLASFDTEAVDEVEIAGPGGTFLLRRRAAGDFTWWLEPQDLPANATKLEYLLQGLASLKGTPVEGAAGQGAGAFGLERPAWRITVRQGSRALLALVVGEAVPVTGSGGERLFYARVAGRPEVYTVAGDLVDDCGGALEEWRERYLADLPAAEVAEVEVAWEGHKVAARRKGESWVLSLPKEGEADAAKVSALINSIAFMEAREFVADHPGKGELRAFGLDRPTVVARLATEKGKRREVLLGKRAAGRPFYYAKLSAYPWVYLVEARSVQALETAAAALLEGRE